MSINFIKLSQFFKDKKILSVNKLGGFFIVDY